MKYTARNADSNVNLPTRHPLIDLLWLLGGLAGLSVVLFFTSGLIVDALVDRIPSTVDNDLPDTITTALENNLGTTLTEGELYDRTQKLFAELGAFLPEDDQRNHTLIIIDADTVNAMAAPGGVIAIFRGLLDEAESENEVALVLAHEYGHLYHKHHWKRLGRGVFFSVIMAVLTGRQDAFQTQLSLAPLSGLQQGHNRSQESAADRFAIEIICRKYGHASGAIDFFARHSGDPSFSKTLSGFFTTHPLSEARVEQLKDRADNLGCGSGATTAWP